MMSHAPRQISSSGQEKCSSRPEKISNWLSRNRMPNAISTMAATGSRLRQWSGGTGGMGGGGGGEKGVEYG